jgi:uracil-DNA glycosylase
VQEGATQTLFSRGSEAARVVLVGEQPGDVEDQRGEPFVGPAGALLRRALGDAEIDPADTYTTNVLARVAGTVYLHLVSAVDASAGRVQISNKRGRVNGSTNHVRIYGICITVDGVRRPRLDGKVRKP